MEYATNNPFNIEPGEAAFVIHAHPDDESVLTGSAIRFMTMSGVIVHGIVGSDGEESTKSPAFSRKRKRVMELIEAYDILGKVPEVRIHRLGLPDGNLPEHLTVAAIRIADLMEQFRPVALFTAGQYGFGHPDHASMHDAAVLAANMTNYGTSVWSLQEDNCGSVRVRSNYSQKMLAVLAHESQFPGSMLPDGSILLPDQTERELEQYHYLLHEYETYELL